MARHGKGAAIQRIQVENEYRDAVKRYGSIVKAATAMRAERGELMGE